jgi:hypothetical protein
MTLATFCNLHALGAVGLTFDLDWAPAFTVHAVVDALAARGLRATLFATHPVEGLSARAHAAGLEIGLHPNFGPGSTHGATPEAVLDRLHGWYPEARGIRTHSLVQSSPLLALMARRGFAWDASLMLEDLPCAQPIASALGLARIPYVWGDASHLSAGGAFEVSALPLGTPGLKVLNFHPLLLALNAEGPGRYSAFKAGCASLERATPADLAPHVFAGRGLRTLFEALLDAIADRGLGTYTLSEVAEALALARAVPGASRAPLSFR